jgi:putative toxin-antitoxin system antitoxin component (TIGR02293 family)
MSITGKEPRTSRQQAIQSGSALIRGKSNDKTSFGGVTEKIDRLAKMAGTGQFRVSGSGKRGGAYKVPSAIGYDAPHEPLGLPKELVVDLFGGSVKVGRVVNSQKEAHDLIVAGLPGKALHRLVDDLTIIDTDNGLETAFGMSRRTFQRTRHEPEKPLSPEQSGRAWVFASILAQAIHVFGGDRQHAETWLTSPAMALDQRKPIELLASPEGVDMVKQLLGRIDHGVYT